jgi:hypothetical protein
VEWRLRGVTVDGGGGTEHDAVHLRALHSRDEYERAGDVVVVVAQGK